MTANKPTELAVTQALLPCPFCGGEGSFIVTFPGCERCALVRRDAHSWNTRLASTAPASGDEVELDRLAELLANFARDRFANTKELTWATMGEHSRQYFRDAVNVVLAALHPRSEREEIANWLREDAPQWGHEALADAIERGDFKESGE